MDKLQIIRTCNHRMKRLLYGVRMTALRPVIVVRSSVQNPATFPCNIRLFQCLSTASPVRPEWQQPHSTADARSATVGIVLAPCRTPAAAAPKQPFRRDRRPAIPAIKQRTKTVGRSPTVWCVAVEAVPATPRPHRREARWDSKPENVRGSGSCHSGARDPM